MNTNAVIISGDWRSQLRHAHRNSSKTLSKKEEKRLADNKRFQDELRTSIMTRFGFNNTSTNINDPDDFYAEEQFADYIQDSWRNEFNYHPALYLNGLPSNTPVENYLEEFETVVPFMVEPVFLHSAVISSQEVYHQYKDVKESISSSFHHNAKIASQSILQVNKDAEGLKQREQCILPNHQVMVIKPALLPRILANSETATTSENEQNEISVSHNEVQRIVVDLNLISNESTPLLRRYSNSQSRVSYRQYICGLFLCVFILSFIIILLTFERMKTQFQDVDRKLLVNMTEPSTNNIVQNDHLWRHLFKQKYNITNLLCVSSPPTIATC